MFAAIEWDSLTHAAAFLVGAVLGTVVTLRVIHIAIKFLRREDDRG